MKKTDWNGVIKKYTSPQAIKDLDSFLDALPLNVGYNGLIIAGFAWLLAGSAVLFASMETEKVSKLHTSLMEVQALQPPIPILKYIPVTQDNLKTLSEKISQTYKGVVLASTAAGEVTLSAQDSDYFPQFLAAISYLQRGGKNWKVKVDTMCVGRECTGPKLSAKLKVETVRIGEPETKKEEDKGLEKKITIGK